MATATRVLTRAAVRATTRPAAAAFTPPRLAAGFRAPHLATHRRYYSSANKNDKQSSSTSSSASSSSPPPEPAKSSAGWAFAAVGLASAGGLWYWQQSSGGAAKKPGALAVRQREDYQKVYDAVAQRLGEMDEYDDGSYGPVLLRLAWHASGTYDAETGTGGSNGATMRFAPEGDHGANAGLKAARDFLEPIKAQFPWITYSDFWILAGVCAIQQMLGPDIPFRPGRSDKEVSFCTPDGRLPDASKGADHLRAIFGRMGFSDQEIVALSGAHALGRCHTDRSGFDGPWTFSPTVLTNDYFKLLLAEKWEWKKWNGPKQYEDKSTKSLMMLPTDMVLIQDSKFRPYVEKYAADNDAFFKDFQKVVVRLFELGVPFAEGTENQRWVFKRKD